MTNERKLQIAQEAEESAFNALLAVQPTSPDFERCVCSIHAVRHLMMIIEVGEQEKREPMPELKSEPDNVPVPDPAPMPEPEPEPESEPEPDLPRAEPETEPVMTKDEIRAVLTAIANEHGSEVIAAAMQGMGYGKLSDVPAARYAELLSKTREAV